VRVLGIDCGSVRTGYGIIESDGVEHRMIAAGVIATDTRRPFERRLLEIAVGLRKLIGEHAPEGAAVEEVFSAANVKSALKLAQARGVALLVLAEAGMDVAEYSPLEVKISVVGYGRAEKSQVKTMVRSLLRLDEELASEDACDALAVAICHSTHEATRRKLASIDI
jgi:crossover junction endodeoxyribonuclease RuvC